jgi:saccharopine dehydrogenase-like NADP-dependent oxidoreductase
LKKIIVLGCGMVGRVMAVDMAKDFDVTAVDLNAANLDRLGDSSVKRKTADLTSGMAVRNLVKDFDLVIGAVPGFMGFKTLMSVVEAGRNAVDISFFPEDALLLNDLAKARGVTAVVDCGVAPGMSNMILGYHAPRMKVSHFKCFVGGLPFKRDFPFEYKAPFSPADVIEEYVRPARYVENGHHVVRPALSDTEFLDFPEIGTLEAFNSDGLRSLIKTMSVPNMIEKTLRYPGHVNHIKALRDSGFLGQDEIEVGGHKTRPIDFTSAVLFKQWHLHEGDDEFTAMRILIEGEDKGYHRSLEYSLFDRTDHRTGFSSMARTTGFPATAVARLILNGKFSTKGVCPPEYVGAEEGNFRDVMDHLQARNVIYTLKG